MIEVMDGVAQGPPRTLLGQFEGWPMGFTADGSFYYGARTTASNVYIARLDSTGLNFEGEPELASSQFVGSTTMGDFSPDGKSLVYRAGRAGQRASGAGSGDWVLVIYSIEKSQEHIVWPSPSFIPDTHMYGPRWSPDGQSLLVCGTGQEGGNGLYAVDAETGTVKLVARGRTYHLIPAVWSPDGESIYVRWQTGVGRLDPVTGRETQLYQGGGGTKGLDVSPDGRWLAFYRGPNSLVVLPSAGGEPREVVHMEGNAGNTHINLFVRWTPDGEHLLFCKRKKELWKIHTETGAQQQIGLVLENLVGATMHPDGRQIAFTVEQSGSELWVMENFLPD